MSEALLPENSIDISGILYKRLFFGYTPSCLIGRPSELGYEKRYNSKKGTSYLHKFFQPPPIGITPLY